MQVILFHSLNSLNAVNSAGQIIHFARDGLTELLVISNGRGLKKPIHNRFYFYELNFFKVLCTT